MLLRLFAILVLVFSTLNTTFAQRSKKVQLNPISLGFDLPDSYKNRTFIKGLAGFVNNIDQLVGSMILIEGNKTSVLTRFVKEGKPPLVTTSSSDVIFNAKIDSKFKHNGAYSIASTKIEKDAIYEVVITDVGVAFLPEDYIPYLEICNASQNVSDDVKKRTYYVRSAKLTTVYTRAFKKTDVESAINGIAFSANGEIYSSSEQFRVDYIVSVDLVSLEKLLALQNCGQLQLAQEMALRERAEKAKIEALKAKEEKNSRENELAAVQVKLDELRRLLGQSTEQNVELQKQLKETVERERQATAQLAEAQRTANLLQQTADKEQQKSDSSEKVILTVKSKEGNVLEIISLDELSAEKLNELGFNGEVLKSKQDE
jgi:low affinity Fe/Cu permease